MSTAQAEPSAPSTVQHTIRLPATLSAAITRQAEQSVRSFNAELVAILKGVSSVPRVGR